MPRAEDLREGPPFTAIFTDIDESIKEAVVINFHISPLFRKKVNDSFPLFLG
jgi:hypothetical protein